MKFVDFSVKLFGDLIFWQERCVWSETQSQLELLRIKGSDLFCRLGSEVYLL